MSALSTGSYSQRTPKSPAGLHRRDRGWWAEKLCGKRSPEWLRVRRAFCASQTNPQRVNPNWESSHHLGLPRSVFPESRRRGPQPRFRFPRMNKKATITDKLRPTNVLYSQRTPKKSGWIAPARSWMMGGENSLSTNCVGINRALRMTNVINWA